MGSLLSAFSTPIPLTHDPRFRNPPPQHIEPRHPSTPLQPIEDRTDATSKPMSGRHPSTSTETTRVQSQQRGDKDQGEDNDRRLGEAHDGNSTSTRRQDRSSHPPHHVRQTKSTPTPTPTHYITSTTHHPTESTPPHYITAPNRLQHENYDSRHTQHSHNHKQQDRTRNRPNTDSMTEGLQPHSTQHSTTQSPTPRRNRRVIQVLNSHSQ